MEHFHYSRLASRPTSTSPTFPARPYLFPFNRFVFSTPVFSNFFNNCDRICHSGMFNFMQKYQKPRPSIMADEIVV